MKIKIGSRASKLAVVQSELAVSEIKKVFPDIETELLTMTTTGDKILNKTLDQIGGKGLFLKELDEALDSGKVDVCVHSLKDMPVEVNEKYPVSAYLERSLPYDVLVLPKGKTEIDKFLPVGCSSARRAIQFKKIFPDVEIKSVRGNVQTRLAKLDSGEYSALILAEAGLTRLGLQDRISRRFTPEEMVPAAGQGIIAVQAVKGEISKIISEINCRDSEIMALTERTVSRALEGDCSSPIGAYSVIDGENMKIYAFYEENGNTAFDVINCKKNESIAAAEKLADILKNKVRNR